MCSYATTHTHLGLLSGVDNLTSNEVDHCTLHFTWTAPYTLQGVPINYYTINITRHSDGAVLRSDTTNTTEYLYTVSSLGETLEVVVAAVNGAGTGNVSSIILQTLSSELMVLLFVLSSCVHMHTAGIVTIINSTDARKNNDWIYVFNIEVICINLLAVPLACESTTPWCGCGCTIYHSAQ